MKKRSGLQIAGGILGVVAGAFWLIVVLFVNQIGQSLGLNLGLIQFVMPIIFIVSGAMACTGKRRKSEVVTDGIVNLLFIGVQFYTGEWAGLGIVQIVLLIVSAFLFFFSKKTQTEIIYNERLKEYIANEPAKIKRKRRSLVIIACLVSFALNAVIVFAAYLIMYTYLMLLAIGVLVGGVVYFFIASISKNKKQYKLTINIAVIIVAFGLSMLISFVFLPHIIDYTTETETIPGTPEHYTTIEEELLNNHSNIGEIIAKYHESEYAEIFDGYWGMTEFSILECLLVLVIQVQAWYLLYQYGSI